MKYVILNGIKNELNFKERIILKLFEKTFIKVYHIIRIRTINEFIK